MGGNAIKKARRITKEEYDTIIAHIAGQPFYVRSNDLYGPENIVIRGEIVKSYRQKEDFGDIDVVIDDRVDIVPIFAHYRPAKCAVNGNVMSIAYDKIQVDFIRVPTEYIQTTLDYYAYNDLGNLLGKIARKLGFKYGSKGLVYQCRDGNQNVIEDISVTKDLEEILTALGLSYIRYKQGFDTLEEIFDFISSSIYFDPALYSFKNATQQNRHRDSKRKTYLAFLEWMDSRKLPALSDYDFHAGAHWANAHVELLKQYPHVTARMVEIGKEQEEDKIFRSRINGEVIGELTGLEGVQLGRFIEQFRALNTKYEILQLTEEQTRERIVDTFDFLKHKAQEKQNG